MMKKSKHITVMVFALSVALFTLNCQCAFASTSDETTQSEQKSCHGPVSEKAQEKSSPKDCCGKCDVENSAIVKNSKEVFQNDSNEHLQDLVLIEQIKLTTAYKYVFLIFKDPPFYESLSSYSYAPRGPPAV